MPGQAIQRQGQFDVQLEPETAINLKHSHMVACVDGLPASRKVIPHALAVAKALGGELTLVEVIRVRASSYSPVDPVEWDIHRNKAQAHIKLLAGEHEQVVATRLLVGDTAEQICNCVRENAATLTALCTHGDGDAEGWNLGNTAQRVADAASGSVLLVPASVPNERIVEYARILVPLDGSLRAESVLPAAIRIAKTYGAELVLVHAIPEPEVRPFEPQNAKLSEHLMDRYEQAASEYLGEIRNRIADEDLSLRPLVLRGEDVRRRLKRAIADEAVDLMVLASHGQCGHADVPFGDVAAHLIAQTRVPVLVMRSQMAQQATGFSGRDVPVGVRLPRQSA